MNLIVKPRERSFYVMINPVVIVVMRSQSFKFIHNNEFD